VREDDDDDDDNNDDDDDNNNNNVYRTRTFKTRTLLSERRYSRH
jgi:hypothetical protein